MSGQWEGGKGDRNRSNNDKYKDNYDKIFGKEVVDLETRKITIYTYEDIREIIEFLEHIDLEEFPVQKAKELYKKFLTLR